MKIENDGTIWDEIAQHVLDIIMHGIIDAKQRIGPQFNPKDITILSPFFLNKYIIRYFRTNPDFIRASYLPLEVENNEISIEGISLTPHFKNNEIVIYHKDYPLHSVEPHIYHIMKIKTNQ